MENFSERYEYDEMVITAILSCCIHLPFSYNQKNYDKLWLWLLSPQLCIALWLRYTISSRYNGLCNDLSFFFSNTYSNLAKYEKIIITNKCRQEFSGNVSHSNLHTYNSTILDINWNMSYGEEEWNKINSKNNIPLFCQHKCSSTRR